ncbi:DUF2141 domain-containing protein [Phenylobacterium sp.]|uniref:DUF2141 domain-containing protein n=1 Tax=Phenylobacterium sp. TaxID=1871053 RepID=UPI0035B1AB9C
MLHLLLLALGLGAAPAAGAAELVIDFPALQGGGQVMFAVYSDAQGWTRRVGETAGGPLPVRAGAAQVRLDLPPGRYAVMAFHDRNGDGRLNTLPVGLPTEPYGFSRDARGAFGPPGWDKAAFSLPASGGRQAIRLR